MILLFFLIFGGFALETIVSDSFYNFYINEIYPDILDKNDEPKDEFSDPTSQEAETFREVKKSLKISF